MTYDPCEHRTERPMPGVQVDSFSTPCKSCQRPLRSSGIVNVYHEEVPHVQEEPDTLRDKIIKFVICVVSTLGVIYWIVS